jgi:hypothetical protein
MRGEGDNLAEIVQKSVAWYASGGGVDHQSFFVHDDSQQLYGVVVVGLGERKIPSTMALLVQLVGDKIIIQEDNTNRPLYETLLSQGIPEENIILRYVGQH